MPLCYGPSCKFLLTCSVFWGLETFSVRNFQYLFCFILESRYDIFKCFLIQCGHFGSSVLKGVGSCFVSDVGWTENLWDFYRSVFQGIFPPSPFPLRPLALAGRVTVDCAESNSVRWEELEAQSTLYSIFPRNRITWNAFTQKLQNKAQDDFLLSGMLLLPCSSHVKAKTVCPG